MSADPYTGAIVISWGDRNLTLRMRWREIAALRAALGGEANDNGVPQWIIEVERACRQQDAETLATVIAACSDMTREEFLDADPPIGFVRLRDALTELILVAQHGPNWQERVREVVGDDARPLARLIRLLQRFRQRPRSVSPPVTSGS